MMRRLKTTIEQQISVGVVPVSWLLLLDLTDMLMLMILLI